MPPAKRKVCSAGADDVMCRIRQLPPKWTAGQCYGLMGKFNFHNRGGAEGNRTPDLYNAIVALSQLSYGPKFHMRAGLGAGVDGGGL